MVFYGSEGELFFDWYIHKHQSFKRCLFFQASNMQAALCISFQSVWSAWTLYWLSNSYQKLIRQQMAIENC